MGKLRRGKVALAAGSDAYPKGWHEGNAGGLDAVDTDLAVGNIKTGVTIFGKVGAYAASFSYEEYYDTPIAGSARYTPTDPGFFCAATDDLSQGKIVMEYKRISNYIMLGGKDEGGLHSPAIGDGTYLHIHNTDPGGADLVVFRAYGILTYASYAQGTLVGGATYTIVDSGFFCVALGSEFRPRCLFHLYTGAAWRDVPVGDTGAEGIVLIPSPGGSTVRVKNTDAISEQEYRILRAS